MRIMGLKSEFSACLGSCYVVFWEDNIKKVGHCWKWQAVILIVQEDKHL